MVKAIRRKLRDLVRRRLMRQVDTAVIEKAIGEAEGRTSVEVRVSFGPWFWGDPRRVAEATVVRLGMAATGERNAVLFFVVPSRRRFVILGDEGIHRRVGQEFWDRLAGAVTGRIRAEHDLSEGLRRGIGEVADRLGEHFPRAADDVIELPVTVDFGGAEGLERD